MKFTAGEQNLAKKYHIDLTKVHEPHEIEQMNRFGYGSVMLNEAEQKLYQASITIYEQYEDEAESDSPITANIKDADRLKYLLLKINSEAYSTLLD